MRMRLRIMHIHHRWHFNFMGAHIRTQNYMGSTRNRFTSTSTKGGANRGVR